MKDLNYGKRGIWLAVILLVCAPKLWANHIDSALINRVGLNIGIIFPVGDGVLQTGAYPVGLSMYLTGTHISSTGLNFELLAGANIMADFGGGSYLALPLLVNWIPEILNCNNNLFTINAFAGLGYTFHHIFSRTEGIKVKNQHTLGINAGLLCNIYAGKKWDLNLRMGVFHAFTRPVQAYFAESKVTSEHKFIYTVSPLLIGFTRKIG